MDRQSSGVDFYKFLSEIPEEIFQNTIIVIKVFSIDSDYLSPCQRLSISTGIKIPVFFPVSHTIRFQGVKNSLHFETFSKVISPSEGELMIQACNYGTSSFVLYTNTPLGEIIIEPVQ